MIFTSLLSLGGLPPFLGFLPKLIVIQATITNNITPTSNNCDSNIINHPILLPRDLGLKFYKFEHRTKMKLEVLQK